MSDLNLALSPAASYLANLLAQQRPGLKIAPYRGVLTPVELDARPTELAALIEGAAVHDLGWLRRVAVRGEDRFRWLSGMVTNTVSDLPANGGAWNLVLNAQGRIQGDLSVWRDGDALDLEIEAAQYERLIAHFDHFIIMDDVELVPINAPGGGSAEPAGAPAEVAIGLTGPKADAVLANLGLPSLPEPMTQTAAQWNGLPVLLRRGYGALASHYSLWIHTHAASELWTALQGAGAEPVGSAALEGFRVAEAIPAYGVDIAERDLPQETSQLRALHFSKGCYLGQEIVERIRSRGNVHRHLRALELEGPAAAPGTEFFLDGTAVGHLTSVAELPVRGELRVIALGMIRAEAELRNQPLDYKVESNQETATGRAHLLAGPPNLLQTLSA